LLGKVGSPLLNTGITLANFSLSGIIPCSGGDEETRMMPLPDCKKYDDMCSTLDTITALDRRIEIIKQYHVLHPSAC